MPKVGPYKIPNHDIETIVDLIDEAAARAQGLKEGPLDEEMFQEEVLDRRGGSYSRYRFSLQQYGFIERSHGADEVELTELFVDVADPIQPEDRENAIQKAVHNIDLFRELYADDIDPDTAETDFRIWLTQNLNLPRDKADSDTIDDLRNLYGPAYRYLRQSDTDDETAQREESGQEQEESRGDRRNTQSPEPESKEPVKDMEEFRIGDNVVKLPKENMEDEWRSLKAVVDAYIESRQGRDS